MVRTGKRRPWMRTGTGATGALAVALTRNETREQRVPNTVGRAADIFGMLATARGAPICDISRAMTWTAPVGPMQAARPLSKAS